jgi:hypothetical protein
MAVAGALVAAALPAPALATAGAYPAVAAGGFYPAPYAEHHHHYEPAAEPAAESK